LPSSTSNSMRIMVPSWLSVPRAPVMVRNFIVNSLGCVATPRIARRAAALPDGRPSSRSAT
jgi:hypothetical protein